MHMTSLFILLFEKRKFGEGSLVPHGIMESRRIINLHMMPIYNSFSRSGQGSL